MQYTEQKRHTMKPIVNARYSKGDSYTKQLTTQLSETTNLHGTEIIQLHEFEVLSILRVTYIKISTLVPSYHTHTIVKLKLALKISR